MLTFQPGSQRWINRPVPVTIEKTPIGFHPVLDIVFEGCYNPTILDYKDAYLLDTSLGAVATAEGAAELRRH
jgi:hypothetical protein